MAQTVRIDEETHRALREFADRDKLSLQDELARLVQIRRRKEILDAYTSFFANMTPEESAAYDADVAAMDGTLMDGLEDDPYEESPAEPPDAREDK